MDSDTEPTIEQAYEQWLPPGTLMAARYELAEAVEELKQAYIDELGPAMYWLLTRLARLLRWLGLTKEE